MSSVALRPATAADVPRLKALVDAAYGIYVERIGFPPRPMTDDYDEIIRKFDVTVAERDGGIIGLVVIGPDEEGFVIDNVAVDPSVKGSGVGKVLLEHAEAEARRIGYDSIYLYTHELMTENQALYSQIGYAEYARRVMPNKATVVFMRKRLG